MSQLFPELEDYSDDEAAPVAAAEPVAAAAPPEAEPPAELASDLPPRLVGSDFSAVRFAKVLGLPGPFKGGPDGEARVTGVRTLTEAQIEVSVEGGGLGEFIVWFHPRGAAPAYGETEHLGIAYSANDDADLTGRRRLLLDRTAKKCKSVRFDQLHRVLEVDPERTIVAADPELEGAPQHGFRILSAYVYGYGARDNWFNFYSDNEIERGNNYSYRGNTVSVLHSELECLFGYPANDDGTVSFFAHARKEEPPAGSDAAADSASFFVTDLHDLDVINTGTVVLDELFASIHQRHPDADIVTLSATCTPIVTGDDVEGAMGRYRDGGAQHNTVFSAHEFHPHLLLMARHIEDARQRELPVVPGSVNLVGFPRISGRAGLEALIERCGVKVHTSVLPEVDPAAVRRYPGAAAQALYPPPSEKVVRIQEVLREAFPEMAVAVPTPPFGPAGTRACVMGLAEALGLGAEVGPRLDAELAAWRGEWEALVARARRYRLGFVVDQAGWRRLDLSCDTTGIPVLDMIVEMGFGLDVLVHAPTGQAERTLSAVAQRVEGVDLTLRTFRDPAGLQAALQESAAVAFYSEIYFDHRLSRAGKARFGPGEFGMGLGGALESLRRLLSLCSLSFYRSYASYLTTDRSAPRPGHGGASDRA